MRVTLIPALACLAALAACGDANEPDAATTASATPMSVEPDGGIGDGATPIASGDATDEMEQTIPASMQGRWGLVANDCKAEYADAAKGLMVVSSDTLRFYESRGKLGEVKSRDANNLDATFAYMGEGMEWTRNEKLSVNGESLTRTSTGDGETFGPETYKKCPA